MKAFYKSFLFLVLMTFSITANAQQPEAESAEKAFTSEKIDEIINLNTPTEALAPLAELIGQWDYTVTIWTTPDAEPDQSTGTIDNKMILGERYLSTTASTKMYLDGHYVPYEGKGIMGYDNIENVYTSMWIDSLNPGMLSATGEYNEENNLIAFTGTTTSSVQKKRHGFRAELQFIDAYTYKYIQFITDETGSEFKTMEIEYKRK